MCTAVCFYFQSYLKFPNLNPWKELSGFVMPHFTSICSSSISQVTFLLSKESKLLTCTIVFVTQFNFSATHVSLLEKFSSF